MELAIENVADCTREVLKTWSPETKLSDLNLDNVGLVVANGDCLKFARKLIDKIIAEDVASLSDITVIEWVSDDDYGVQYLHVMIKVYDMLYDPFYYEGIRLRSDEHEREVLDNLFAVFAHRLKISTGGNHGLKVEGKLHYTPTGANTTRTWDEIYVSGDNFVNLK